MLLRPSPPRGFRDAVALVARDCERAVRNKVELCLTSTYASWANPIEAQFGPLRTFVIAG